MSFSSHVKDVRVVRKELIDYLADTADPDGSNRMLQDFKKETRVLKLLRHTKNPRIVKLLGSYVYKGVYNLLFPLTDIDLDNFLQGKPHSWVFRHNDEIVEELRGFTTRWGTEAMLRSCLRAYCLCVLTEPVDAARTSA
jgi:hypothetical protein